MQRKRKRLNYIRVAVLILLPYIHASTGLTTPTSESNETITESTVIPDYKATTLAPTAALNAPENTTVEEEASNNTALSVSWDHDPGFRPDVTYHINVDSTDGSETAENVTHVTSGVVVTGKTPGKEYVIIVMAVDDVNGDMATSVPQTFRLSPNMVVNLTREDSNSTTVKAQWDRPFGEVSGYRVNCADGEPENYEIIGADETTSSCSGGNIAGKEVTMTVVTVSVDKESVPDSVTIRANPNPVENLMESSADTSSVTATWTAPSSGEVDDYKVTCSSGNVSPFVNNSNQFEASCTEIEAGENITVTVSSISGSIESIPKSILITAYPNAVVLTESGATTDSVTVRWNKPDGFFDSHEGSCSDGSLAGTLDTSSTSATCTGVTPGIVVTVTVNTTSGNKESSSDTHVTAMPNAVLNLMEVDATTSSVTVSWTSPGGIFDSYDVSCSDGDLDGTLTADSTEATCKGVTGGNLVNVTVYTFSGAKTNSDSENVRALPYTVVNLMEIGATMETIKASWQSPGGVVSKYQVSCSDGIANPREVTEDDSTEYSSTCEELKRPGDNYNMTVTSVSGTKYGAADTVQITAVPASPELQGLPSTVENVSVSWSHPDGIIDSFEVKCEPESISEPVPRFINGRGFTSFEAACEVERPGELFNLSVISVSGNKESSVSVESLRA